MDDLFALAGWAYHDIGASAATLPGFHNYRSDGGDVGVGQFNCNGGRRQRQTGGCLPSIIQQQAGI
jgi:hypothetical protein